MNVDVLDAYLYMFWWNLVWES